MLPINVTEIRIEKYMGRPVPLQLSLLERYPDLEYLSIRGPITAIEENAFSKNPRLKSIDLLETHFESLPSNLFEPIRLNSLSIVGSRLTKFPTNVFHSLDLLKALELDNMNISSFCDSHYTQLEPEFGLLRSLKHLYLKNVLNKNSECLNQSYLLLPAFFTPLYKNGLHSLSLRSNFFRLSKGVFHHLTDLDYLELSFLDELYRCPKALSKVLPDVSLKMEDMILEGLTERGPMKPECTLLPSDFYHLRKLPNLRKLSFADSDRIFGTILPKGLFSNMSLAYLDLTQIGVTTIEPGAFEWATLRDIRLGYNPFGKRPFFRMPEGSTQLVTPELRTISIRGICRCDATPYKLDHLFETYPDIEYIDMGDNAFQSMPIFTKHEKKLKIFRLHMDKNQLKSFYPVNMSETMPHLAIFDGSHNKLYSIETLRVTQRLHLMDNYLGTNFENFCEVLKTMKSLTGLDLATNRIKNASCLSLLKTWNTDRSFDLILRDNYLTSLDFLHRGNANRLQVSKLDLATNYISFGSADVKKLDPDYLEFLDLSDNHIGSLDEEFAIELRKFTKLKELRLDRNPFNCTCKTGEWFPQWLRETFLVPNHDSLVCKTSSGQSVKIVDFKNSYYECEGKWILVGLCAALAVVTLSTLVTLCCYKYRWFICHISYMVKALGSYALDLKTDSKCLYTAFVSYNQYDENDSDWVREELLPAVETYNREQPQVSVYKSLYIILLPL